MTTGAGRHFAQPRQRVAVEEYREDGVFYRATVKIDDLHRFEAFWYDAAGGLGCCKTGKSGIYGGVLYVVFGGLC